MKFSEELLRHLRTIHELLAQEGIGHAFMGGIAINLLTIPVPTYDLDLTLALESDQADPVIRLLEKNGYVPPLTAFPDRVGPQRFPKVKVQFYYEGQPYDADIFFASTDYQRAALARSRDVEIDEGLVIPVFTVEDLLLHKMIAWRPKDRAAVERLLCVQRDLDWPYMRKWVDRLHLGERFREALADAGLAEPGP